VPRKEYLEEITKVFKEHIMKEDMDAERTTPFGRHELMGRDS
jgi:hypothetical protein